MMDHTHFYIALSFEPIMQFLFMLFLGYTRDNDGVDNLSRFQLNFTAFYKFLVRA